MSLLLASYPAPVVSLPGFMPQCYDFSDGTNAYLYSGAAAHGLTNSTAFTLVMCFEVTAGDYDPTNNLHLICEDGSRVRIRLLAFSGAAARAIKYEFYSVNIANEWTGTTDLTISTGAKHVVAFSYEAGVRAQVYIDGMPSTITGEVDESPTVAFTGYPLSIGSDSTHTIFAPKLRVSHYWLKTGTSDDLSTALANYVSGTTPLDNANGAQLYMKMDDATSDGSTSTTWTVAGGPSQENY